MEFISLFIIAGLLAYIAHLKRKMNTTEVKASVYAPVLFQVGDVVLPKKQDYDIIKSNPETVNAIITTLFYTVGISMQDFQNINSTNDQLRVKQGYVNAYGNIIMTLKSLIEPPKKEESSDLV